MSEYLLTICPSVGRSVSRSYFPYKAGKFRAPIGAPLLVIGQFPFADVLTINKVSFNSNILPIHPRGEYVLCAFNACVRFVLISVVRHHSIVTLLSLRAHICKLIVIYINA